MEDLAESPGVRKPVQTKWATGFVQGDPFEDRKVVLDEALLFQAQAKVTVTKSNMRELFEGAFLGETDTYHGGCCGVHGQRAHYGFLSR
jgi:hypothetical protein